MPWKAIACSATGTSHEKLGLPCQDYAGFIRVNDSGDADLHSDIVIGAVCDGAGSCQYSDIGSELAVKTTLECLQNCLKQLKQQARDLSLLISEAYARKVFVVVVKTVKKAFTAKAQEMGWSPKDLSCTLLAVVATPQWLAAMQIGDGFIVIQQADSEYQLLFQPSKGECANQTTFVTATNALDTMQVKVLPGKQQFIFASTDGLERLALNDIAKEAKPHSPFFNNFRDAIKIPSEAQEKISTKKWLQWEEVNKKTDDDKTILLCWYDSVKATPQPSASLVPPLAGVPPQPELPRAKAVTPETTSGSQSADLESEKFSQPAAVASGKEEDFTVEVGAFVINVLAGIFWNSLYHDLWMDFSFNSLPLRNLIGLIIAAVMAGLILLVDWQLYQQKIKQYSPDTWKTKGHLFLYMAIVYLAGLGLGGLSYYLIYICLWNISNWTIPFPNTPNTNQIIK